MRSPALRSDPAPHENRRVGSTPASDKTLGVGESRPPDTLKEAANTFEEVLVRQFVEVMTKDMFSGSYAGNGGGGWMKTQRARQRDFVTDLIADRLAQANTLEVSKKLAREWGIKTNTPDLPASTPAALKPRSLAPIEASKPSQSHIDLPSATLDESNVDHAV